MVMVMMLITSGVYTAYAEGIVQSTTLITNTIPEEGDLFGTSVASVGDIDGNGTPDIIVGAPKHHVQEVGAGDVHILMLENDASVLDSVVVNVHTTGGSILLEEGDLFGTSVASIGDIDGNGTVDILVGAPGHHTQNVGTGNAYVILLENDGSILNSIEINARSNGLDSLEEGDLFGTSVASIGDIDGDGITDIAIGAPGHNSRGITTGDVYLIMLNNDGTVKDATEIHAFTPNGPILGPGDRFGTSITSIGDLDGNGIIDLAVGAPGHYDRGVATGSVYVILLGDNGNVLQSIGMGAQTPNGPASLEKDDLFGTSVASVGDIDGNGVIDMAVGAPGHSTRDVGTGDLFVMYLQSDGSVIKTVEINSDTPNGPILGDGDMFGASVASVGDIDGNGIMDIAVGAPGADAVHIIFMSPRSTIVSGVVFSDVNNDGVQDMGEPGIEGHTMIVYDSASGMFTELVTSSDGEYSHDFEVVPELLLIQSSYYPSGTILSSGEWYRYVASEQIGVIQFDVGFYPVPAEDLVRLEITTFYDDNRNGIRDAGEAAFPNVDVSAYTYTIGPLSHITTDENGMATRADLVPAAFLAQVVLPAGYEATSPIHTYSNGVEVPGALIIDGISFDSTYTMMIGLAPVP